MPIAYQRRRIVNCVLLFSFGRQFKVLYVEINYFIGEVLRVVATHGNLIYSSFKENILFRMKSIATGVSSLTALSSAALASLQVRSVYNISAISRVPGWRSQEFSMFPAASRRSRFVYQF